MRHDSIEFHNIEQLRRIEGREGLLMQRIPEPIRIETRPKTQEQYLRLACSEIRLVSNAYPVRVRLYNYGGVEKVAIYFGDFQHDEIVLNEGLNIIELNIPERIQKLISVNKSFRFFPGVARMIFQGLNGDIHYLGVEGNGVRPPDKTELPSLRYLAYGTSITHGFNATTPVLGYAAQTAWRLNADLIDLGSSGNAYCEDILADYIASRNDWDFASFCISVNMLNQGVSAAEFYRLAKNMLHKVAFANAHKPIFCISIIPYFMDCGIRNPLQSPKSTPDEYRDIIKRIVSEASDAGLSNVYYVDGRDLLDEFGGMATDLLHPGNMGMIRIAENLAKVMRRCVGNILK